jgi:hypothetical protein
VTPAAEPSTVAILPTPDSDRLKTGQASLALYNLQRWRYQGRRHQRGPLSEQRTAAALLGSAVAAVLLVLAVATWPTPRRNNNVVLPEIPRAPLTFTPSLPSWNSPSGSATPSGDGTSATAVPSGPPPLPTPSAEPPMNPVKSPAPAPPPHNIPITAFEAESAANTLFGQARIRDNPDASGGQAIGFLGTNSRGSSGALRINGLKVPTPGTYTLTIFYISGWGDRNARISVNRAMVVSVTFPSTGDWNTVGSLTLRIKANAGSNFVEIDNPDDWAPDIDRVVLSN